MQFLKANTQVIVTVGPFVDVGDGFTPQTDIALSGNEAELIKHGSTSVVDISGATWAAVTSCRGYYSLTLTANHTNTEGMLLVVVQDDSDCLPVKQEYMVLSNAAYDSMFVAKDDGFMDVNLKTIGRTDTQETEANNLESACSNYSVTRGLTGTALPAAVAEASGGVFTRGSGAGQINQSSNGQVDVNLLDIRGVSQRAVDLAEICQYLIANSAEPITDYVADDSLLAKLLAADGDISAYDDTNHSLEALRVQGDAAWTTATSTTVSDKTGFSLSTAGVNTVADQVWDELIAGHTGSTTFGGKNQKVVPSETAADYKATGFSTLTSADVTAAANTTIVAYNLDHLMKTAVNSNADMTTEVADGTVLSNIMTSDSDTSGFAVASHSLEAVGAAAISSAAWGSINSGISFRGVVTAADPGVSFTIGGLAGQGSGAFVDATTPWWAYVFRDAGGASAAPQGEQQQVTAYTTATGLFTTNAFTTPVAVGDDIVIMTGRIASIPDILVDTATTIPGLIAALENLSAADVQTAANTALVALNLDHLMKTAVNNNADMTDEVTDGTVLSNIMSASSDTSTYVVADDSLQGISEGAAGGGVTAQQVWEYAGGRPITGLTAAALKDFFDTDSTTTFASAVSGSVVKEIGDQAGGATAAQVWAFTNNAPAVNTMAHYMTSIDAVLGGVTNTDTTNEVAFKNRAGTEVRRVTYGSDDGSRSASTLGS